MELHDRTEHNKICIGYYFTNPKLKGMTITEASDYFDKHDIFEFKDVREVTDIKFDIKKKKYIGVDSGLYKKIKSKAKLFMIQTCRVT